MSTDDIGMSAEFLADEDVVRDEDNWPSEGPDCGGRGFEFMDGQWEKVTGCSGCRHCDPVDHEAKPYGWDIERFEDAALTEANIATSGAWIGGPYRSLAGVSYTLNGHTWCGSHFNRELRDAIWDRLSTWSESMWQKSERVWDRICDRSQTHGEAVERYTTWAITARSRS